jgi:hypothetical protein
MEIPPTSTTGMESQSRWKLFDLWEWIVRWLTTLLRRKPMPSNDMLLQAYIAQNERLMKLAEQQQATLDRIVLAKFDQPVHGRVTQQRQSAPMFPPMMMADALGAETDEEFFEKLNTTMPPQENYEAQ